MADIRGNFQDARTQEEETDSNPRGRDRLHGRQYLVLLFLFLSVFLLL